MTNQPEPVIPLSLDEAPLDENRAFTALYEYHPTHARPHTYEEYQEHAKMIHAYQHAVEARVRAEDEQRLRTLVEAVLRVKRAKGAFDMRSPDFRHLAAELTAADTALFALVERAALASAGTEAQPLAPVGGQQEGASRG